MRNQKKYKGSKDSFTEQYAGILKTPIGDIEKLKDKYFKKKYRTRL